MVYRSVIFPFPYTTKKLLLVNQIKSLYIPFYVTQNSKAVWKVPLCLLRRQDPPGFNLVRSY